MARPLLRPLRSSRNPIFSSCFSSSYQKPFLPTIASAISHQKTHLLPLPSLRSQHSNNTHRLYHSRHHPNLPPHEYTNSQTTILSAALKHVPVHGFTHDALTLGARDTGFLDVSIQLLPRGEFDLILFWLASRRGLLRAAVEQNGLLTKSHPEWVSVEEKTKTLIMERLRMNADIRHQWQDALALMSLPSHIPLSLSELHDLSSDILQLAGDTSVDASWYSKRLSVSAIYASAEIVMTRDSSPDLSATEAFVTRRIEDSKTIGEKITGAKQCLGFMGSTAVGLGRSWGLKV
ncbi:COQ9-domain-containing protein [Aspergillus cavernicola]|uniref:Ubiquinone biosynthesis protein n=1 Tax=Aspergillus cavernicola TaxID=176166 RepID=A0ABR4IML2_9EURO